MSNQEAPTDLTKSGEQVIADIINMQNPTAYTPDDLVIGRPEVSNDPAFNTDIEVTLPPSEMYPEGETVEFHYSRIDLGHLFRNKDFSFRDFGYQNIRELGPRIAQEVPVVFELNDLLSTPIPTGGYPKTVILRAAPESLRFFGQFSLTLTKEDVVSMLVAPTTTEGATLNADALREDGTMLAGTGNPGDNFIVVQNGELELAGGARIFNDLQAIEPSNGKYIIDLADDQDWNIPHSFTMIDHANSATITDLYDVTMQIQSVQTGDSIDLTLVRVGAGYRFNDPAMGISISSGTRKTDGSVYQDIQRLSNYIQKFQPVPLNGAGAPLGEYEITVKAVRKYGDNVPAMYLNYTITVVAVEEEAVEDAPMGVMAFSSFNQTEEPATTEGDEPTADESGFEREFEEGEDEVEGSGDPESPAEAPAPVADEEPPVTDEEPATEQTDPEPVVEDAPVVEDEPASEEVNETEQVEDAEAGESTDTTDDTETDEATASEDDDKPSA